MECANYSLMTLHLYGEESRTRALQMNLREQPHRGEGRSSYDLDQYTAEDVNKLETQTDLVEGGSTTSVVKEKPPDWTDPAGDAAPITPPSPPFVATDEGRYLCSKRRRPLT